MNGSLQTPKPACCQQVKGTFTYEGTLPLEGDPKSKKTLYSAINSLILYLGEVTSWLDIGASAGKGIDRLIRISGQAQGTSSDNSEYNTKLYHVLEETLRRQSANAGPIEIPKESDSYRALVTD